MRLFRFGEPGRERPGIVDTDGVHRDASTLVEDWRGEALAPAHLAGFSASDLSSLPEATAGARFGACVAGTSNFIAVGLNYADHAAESGAAVPTHPILFNKAPSCIVGPNDDIRIPRGSLKTDWEVELAVVIGATGSYVDETDALGIVAGYCVCNDVSEREYQLELGGGQWAKGKGCPTFGPLGPYLVTPDQIADVQQLGMWLDVNGTKRQRGSTSTMIFGVAHLIAHISQFMELRPGDVITTGTPPGVGLGMKPPTYLAAGDTITLGIEGLGEQRQRVVAKPQPA